MLCVVEGSYSHEKIFGQTLAWIKGASQVHKGKRNKCKAPGAGARRQHSKKSKEASAAEAES